MTHSTWIRLLVLAWGGMAFVAGAARASTGVVPARTSEPAEPHDHDHDHAHDPHGADHDYDRSWRFLAGFDERTKRGALLRTTSDGGTALVHARAGWHIERIHDQRLGDLRVMLVLWRSYPDGARTSPALWVEGFDGEITDLVHRWPATPGATEWENAEVTVVRRGDALRIGVVRDLVGENRARPRLRKREVYQATPFEMRRIQQRYARATTPEQVLNGIADLLEQEDVAGARDHVRRLPKSPRVFRERAAILFTRLAEEGAARAASRELLGALVDADTPASSLAADRLLEMSWEDLVP